MRARVSDASMATRADGRGSCSTTAQARPPPGCVLRAVLRGAAHPSPTAVEKRARTRPCLHSWEPVAERLGVGNTRGPSAARTGPGCLRSQPRLPWSPRTPEAHMCQMFWKPGQRFWLCGSPGSPRLPLLQGSGGGGGMGQPSSRRFLIKSRLWTCSSHLFYCLYGNYQPLKELWPVPSPRV